MDNVAPVTIQVAEAPSLRKRLISFIVVAEAGVIAALLFIVVFFYILQPAFLSERNIRAILDVVLFVGIIAIGRTVLLVTGELDFSVGSVAGVSAVSAAQLMSALAWPIPLSMMGGIGVCIGLVNGNYRRQMPHSRLHPDAEHTVHWLGSHPTCHG